MSRKLSALAMWLPLCISGATTAAVAAAAAWTSVCATERGTGIAAWVAVAVIGTASMISAAKAACPSDNAKDAGKDRAE